MALYPEIYCLPTRILAEPSKISTLTQGMFVGAVSDNFDERIDLKIFHAEIVVDNAKVAKETKAYKPIPIITDFRDEQGNDNMEQMVMDRSALPLGSSKNYIRIKNDVKQIVNDELERVKQIPEQARFIKSDSE